MLQRTRGVQRVISLTALALAGCMTWHPVDLASTPSPDTGLPYVLRITRTDSARVTVLSPHVRGDTLYGRVVRDTIGIPLARIRVAERQRFNPLGTVVLVIAVPVAFIVTWYVIHCGASGRGCAAVAI